MSRTPSNSSQRTTPEFSRAALAPGLLGVIALMAGLALLDSEWFIIIRFAVAIMALILCVYANNARKYWWLAPLLAVAIVWNPVFPLPLEGQGWQFLQLAGAFVFLAAAFMIKVPIDSENKGAQNKGPQNKRPQNKRPENNRR